MKNTIRLLGIIAVIAIIGFTITACDGPMGPEGVRGEQGLQGDPGSMLELKNGIDQDGYPNLTWWIDGVDTHIAAAGKDGDVGTIDATLTIDGNGNWVLDGVPTNRPARGPAGTAGTQITISEDNTWVMDGVDTHIPLTGPAGQNGSNGTIGSILSIGPAPDYNWYINGEDTGVSASARSGDGSGNGNGNGGDPDPACEHTSTDWRLTIPMPNIVSLLEEEYCTVCDDTLTGRRKTYGNLTHWLNQQSGGTQANPIDLEVAIALGATNVDTAGWGDLLYAIEAAGKYVSLDLSECTLSSTQFQGAAFTTGKAYVVHITFPYGTAPGYSSAFSTGFTNLKSATGYGDVGPYAFQDCTSLTEVSFPNAANINVWAFMGCTGLTEVSFPNVTTINASAFEGCTNLERVSFPNATTIYSNAFKSCTKLERVYFPNVTTLSMSGVDWNCFEGCTALTEAYFPKATGQGTNNMFKDCTALKEVYFYAATVIAANAFNGCAALERLYVPLVRTIGQNALTGCEALTDITITRNCTIDATGQSARAISFNTYYTGTGGSRAGTYIYNGTAWTGEF